MWVIFALLDPDSDSEYGTGSTDPIESRSNSDPDPQPCSYVCVYLSDESLLVLDDLRTGVEALEDELVRLLQPDVHGPHGTVGEGSDAQLLPSLLPNYRNFGHITKKWVYLYVSSARNKSAHVLELDFAPKRAEKSEKIENFFCG